MVQEQQAELKEALEKTKSTTTRGEIDLMTVDQCDSVAETDEDGGGSVAGGGSVVDVDVKLEREVFAEAASDGRRRRMRGRGRPARIQQAKASTTNSPPLLRKKREDEDVCFICFDGGSLVLCDRRGCPKAYHPACVKRDEAFFRSRAKWNCGWHICNSCQKDSFYMCYTCPYSVCKICVRSADYSSVRGSKGFCGICMKTILLIENAAEGDKEKVQVDFDDQTSWEYLFKIYWIGLKEKLSLSMDELTQAKNPWKRASAPASRAKPFDRSDDNVCCSDNSCGDLVGSHSKRRKIKSETTSANKLNSVTSKRSWDNIGSQLRDGTKWATKELLEFVAHMKNGDTSVLSQYDVQALVLEYARRNNLQDPLKNSQIICDSGLMSLFRKERVDQFEMLKLLESHFLVEVSPPAANMNSVGVIEAPGQIEVSRKNESLNRSPWNQGKESQILDLPNILVGRTGPCHSNPAVMRPSEPSIPFSKELPPVHAARTNEPTDSLETNRIWQYQDPTGKIQGPFSMLHLRNWSTTGHFPSDLRIWKINESQNDSILLTAALNRNCHKAGTLQNVTLPAVEPTAQQPVVEIKKLDVNLNSLCIEASVISSGNSVITGNSDASNRSANSSSFPLEFAISSQKQTGNSACLWDKPKHENPLPSHPQVSCLLSLGTFPGNSGLTMSHEVRENQGSERWNAGQSTGYMNPVKNVNSQNGIGLGFASEKQGDTGGNSIQSCGQNWKATPVNSSSTVWDSASGFVSLADAFNASKLIQEIDFLDLPSPTLKSSLASTTSDWQPILADLNECDESVSDLLAEVEAMESLKGLPSPTSTFRYNGELTRVSEIDRFSPADRLSPALDVSKGDAMSSTNDLQMHPRTTAMERS